MNLIKITLKTGTIIFLMSFFFVANGQEFIKEFDHTTVDTSIIREYGQNQWVIYNYTKPSLNYCNNDFILINNSSGPANLVRLYYNNIQMRFLDFKIVDSTLYFCGKTIEEDTSRAVMGFFDMDNFPTISPSIIIVSRMSVFENLDVYEVGNNMHVVMTGRGRDGKGLLIDACELLTDYWSFAFNYYQNELFYDVAVTEDYVVATSAAPSSFPSFIYESPKIWYYQKPSVANQCIFQNSPIFIFYTDIHNRGSSTIDYQYNNYFTILHHTRSPRWGIKLRLFDGFNSTGLFIPTSIYNGRDITCCRERKGYDILVDSIFTTGKPNMVLHIPDGYGCYGGLLQGHLFPDNHLVSIEGMNENSMTTIATGIEKEGTNLRQYRLKFDEWSNCTQAISLLSEQVNQTINEEDWINGYIYYTYWRHDMSYIPLMVPITTICDVREEDSENSEEINN